MTHKLNTEICLKKKKSNIEIINYFIQLIGGDGGEDICEQSISYTNFSPLY